MLRNTEDYNWDQDQAWTAELQYKGANPADAGSWGMYAGYRQIELLSVIAPTCVDIIGSNRYKVVCSRCFLCSC